VPLDTSEEDLISEDLSQPDRGRKRPPLQDSLGPAGLRMKDQAYQSYFDCGDITTRTEEDTGKEWETVMDLLMEGAFLPQYCQL
jgi:hypothetical protein